MPRTKSLSTKSLAPEVPAAKPAELDWRVKPKRGRGRPKGGGKGGLGKGRGLTKKMKPSKELSALFDTKDPLSHSQVLSLLWAYIKKNKLQKTDDMSMVIPDNKMEVIFGTEEFSTAGMLKYIKGHLE